MPAAVVPWCEAPWKAAPIRGHPWPGSARMWTQRCGTWRPAVGHPGSCVTPGAPPRANSTHLDASGTSPHGSSVWETHVQDRRAQRVTQGGGSVPSRERVHGLRAPRTAARESLPRAIFTPWGSLAGSFPVPNCCDQTFINLTRKRKSGKSKCAAASEAGWAGLGQAPRREGCGRRRLRTESPEL